MSSTRVSRTPSSVSSRGLLQPSAPKVLAARYKNPRSKSEYLTKFFGLKPLWTTLQSVPYEAIAEFIDTSHKVSIDEFDAANALIIMNTMGKYKTIQMPIVAPVGSRTAERWWGTEA